MNSPRADSVAQSVCSNACGDERELLSRLQTGDAGAYEVLVREFGPRMLTVARRFLSHPQDSADAVQDAFVSAFQSIHSFQGQSTLATWLHRITVNSCLMLLRSQGRHRSASWTSCFRSSTTRATTPRPSRVGTTPSRKPRQTSNELWCDPASSKFPNRIGRSCFFATSSSSIPGKPLN